ncbi:MAG: DUF1700 domain-containing protein [Oscillospiraceae bacterium]|nr:DUF1700 domain-containing protein [Oscillospiraceae bacterium]
MNKNEFLEELRKGLSGLPQDDIEERLTFYSEMIDDRMEEGLSQEEAVAEIGSVKDIVSQIMSEIPLSRIVKEKVKPKRALRAWEIVLLALGSPIWISLLIAALAIVFSVYVVLWSVIICLWAAGLGIAGGSLGGILSAVIFTIQGNFLQGAAVLGATLVCAGIFILWFFICQQTLKGILLLTKKLALGFKYLFVGKEKE